MNYTTADYLNQLQQDRQDLADNLTTKGITDLTGDETFTELVPKVLEIPSGGGSSTISEENEKDVSFLDYDGTIIYTYTLDEIQAMESLPEGPTHDGLTFQAWNWTLQELKTYNYPVDVGANYTTDDGKTRIYVTLTEETLNPTMNIPSANTIIDWGDGTIETIETTGNKSHQYSQAGNYIIKITPSSSGMTLPAASNNGSNIFYNPNNDLDNSYRLCVTKIEIGDNIKFSQYNPAKTFVGLRNLKTISIPANTTPNFMLFQKTGLIGVVIPRQSSSDSRNMSSMFSDCFYLKRISLPYTRYFMQLIPISNAYSLRKIKIAIPQSDTGVFSNAYSLSEIAVAKNNSVPANWFLNNAVQTLEITGTVSFPTYGTTSYIEKIIDYSTTTSKNMSYMAVLQEYITNTNNATLNTNCFNGANSLRKVVFEKNVTSIGQNAFTNCYSLLKIDLSHCTAVPTLNSSLGNNLNADLKIIVPDSLYEDWVADSNWSTYSSYIVKASEA